MALGSGTRGIIRYGRGRETERDNLGKSRKSRCIRRERFSSAVTTAFEERS